MRFKLSLLAMVAMLGVGYAPTAAAQTQPEARSVDAQDNRDNVRMDGRLTAHRSIRLSARLGTSTHRVATTIPSRCRANDLVSGRDSVWTEWVISHAKEHCRALAQFHTIEKFPPA